jgi:hypothetical protein
MEILVYLISSVGSAKKVPHKQDESRLFCTWLAVFLLLWWSCVLFQEAVNCQVYIRTSVTHDRNVSIEIDGMYWQDKTKAFGEKTCPSDIFSRKIPHGVTWGQTTRRPDFNPRTVPCEWKNCDTYLLHWQDAAKNMIFCGQRCENY